MTVNILDLLKRLEWMDLHGPEHPVTCPICGGNRQAGHKLNPPCELRVLVMDLEAQRDEINLLAGRVAVAEIQRRMGSTMAQSIASQIEQGGSGPGF